MRAGARGYLLKGVGEPEIAAAIRSFARGDALFGSGVSRRLLDHVTGRRATARPFAELSPREEQVLDLIATGLGNVAIAARLSIAPKTVRNTVSDVLAKIGAEDRAGAVRSRVGSWARRTSRGSRRRCPWRASRSPCSPS